MTMYLIMITNKLKTVTIIFEGDFLLTPLILSVIAGEIAHGINLTHHAFPIDLSLC